MDAKRLLAILAGALALISIFAGPGLIMVAVAVILLAVAQLI